MYQAPVDYKKYGQRPYILAAPIAFIIVLVAMVLGALLDPSYNYFGNHNISDLGIAERNIFTSILFNSACCIGGVLISAFGFGKYHFEKEDWNEKAGVFFFIGGVGLIFVGVFTADLPYPHNFFAGVFATGMVLGVVLSTLQDIKEGDKFILYSSIIILAYLIIEWPFFSNALSESMSILCATVWFLIQLNKYKKQGKLEKGYVAPSE